MEEHRHLNSDGLLRAAYGIESDVQWRDCVLCRAAVEGLSSRRAGEPQIDTALPEWFWQRQRQSVLGAVDAAAARPARFRWTAVGALAAIVVAGWLLMQPVPAPAVRIAREDERLLTEVSAAVNRVEPQALSPMNMLWTQ
jgi:hypothetical protein